MRKIVGIDRKIKRAWMDAALDRLSQTTDEVELRTFLDTGLMEELPGVESRRKSIGILLRIWNGIPPERVALRDRAVALLPRISGQERIWLHWGMAALAYPFFRDIAEIIGRLLALQDDFTTAQVTARMLSTWGDRATSKEAAQKLINMLVDWEVLRSTKAKGHFLPARKMTACIPDLQVWLLDALLSASAADEIEAQQLLRLPESFPFTISVGVADLRKHEGFNIHRQGLDMDMVALRKVRLEPPPKPTKKRERKKPVPSHVPGLFGREIEGIPSSNGKVKASPVVVATTRATVARPADADERQRADESFAGDVHRVLTQHADRLLQIRCAHLSPEDRPFTAASNECLDQFRDGRFLGCIALAQATLQAVVHRIWSVSVRRKANQKGDFERNVSALHLKNLICEELKEGLDKMWADRHALYIRGPSPDSDQQIRQTAQFMLKLLHDIEGQFFAFSMREGTVLAIHPEYWLAKDEKSRAAAGNRG